MLVLFAILAIALAAQAYIQYFQRWGKNENTFYAFSGNYVNLGHWLATQPNDTPKYVIINAPGGDVRGIPMPSQTVMFLTNTFLPSQQKIKNITYLLPAELQKISCAQTCVITMLEYDSDIVLSLQKQIPLLNAYLEQSFIFLRK
ncbi:MAG: hypothetical protein HZC14_02120 [Candidatus Niyogibacteria bacterium]|nr:hypothetical protein [Candidatus Niyogibacteria bacterium]